MNEQNLDEALQEEKDIFLQLEIAIRTYERKILDINSWKRLPHFRTFNIKRMNKSKASVIECIEQFNRLQRFTPALKIRAYELLNNHSKMNLNEAIKKAKEGKPNT